MIRTHLSLIPDTRNGADPAWLCDAAFLKAYEGIYHHRAAIGAGKDDRMVLVDNAIWTHILRFAEILPGGNESRIVMYPARFQTGVGELCPSLGFRSDNFIDIPGEHVNLRPDGP